MRGVKEKSHQPVTSDKSALQGSLPIPNMVVDNLRRLLRCMLSSERLNEITLRI